MNETEKLDLIGKLKFLTVCVMVETDIARKIEALILLDMGFELLRKN